MAGYFNATKRERARRLAAALKDTADRYCRGLMSHGTFTTHMRALWDKAAAEGLRDQVAALVAPRIAKGMR